MNLRWSTVTILYMSLVSKYWGVWVRSWLVIIEQVIFPPLQWVSAFGLSIQVPGPNSIVFVGEGVSPHMTPSYSGTPSESLRIQLNSDTICLEKAPDYTD